MTRRLICRIALCPALLVSFLNGGAVVGADAAATPHSDTSMLVYFGTYTGPKSKGIYVARLDLGSGQLSNLRLAGETTSPSYVALRPNGKFLYAVNEVSRYQGQKGGFVSSFQIDPADGTLTPLNQTASGGESPCHLSVDASGRVLLVANYGTGSCAAFRIEPDGRIGERTAFDQHEGHSVNPQRQEGPHAHGIYPGPQNRFVFVPDLGLDKVMVYGFDPAKGSLAPNAPPFAVLPPGSGPRHLAFSPNGSFAYVISEMACTVTAFSYDADHGQLHSLQSVSSLPPGTDVQPNYTTAEIEVHPSGRFVYGSNRGHNSITVFATDPGTGRLTFVQSEPTKGKTPRGFAIDPTGQFLIAGNQDSDSVVVFQIDRATGRLRPTGQTLELGAPVCVKFLRPGE